MHKMFFAEERAAREAVQHEMAAQEIAKTLAALTERRSRMGIIEWLWRFLPDRCEMRDCARRGVRGNENVVAGFVMCDDCHSDMQRPGDRTDLPTREKAV